MTNAIYLIGAPGSGKSTVMNELLRGWAPGPYQRLMPRELFGHQLLGPDLDLGVYLGHLRPEYPGTDALSMSVSPHAISWLQVMGRPGWVFGEGQRLGNLKFLKELNRVTELRVGYLDLPPEVAAERRSQRPGKALSDGFVKSSAGRALKCALHCSMEGIWTTWLDATKSPSELADILFTGYDARTNNQERGSS